MSRSGIAVSDEVVSAFNELKLSRKVKFVVFRINPGLTEIVVDKTSSDDDYETFVGELPEAECRYAVYDFEYDTPSGEGKRSKIIFITWTPDTARIRDKMVYASSQDAIRRALNGVSTEVQASDFDEIAYETILGKVSRAPGSH